MVKLDPRNYSPRVRGVASWVIPPFMGLTPWLLDGLDTVTIFLGCVLSFVTFLFLRIMYYEAKNDLLTHNELFRCERCDEFHRAYQASIDCYASDVSCPDCGTTLTKPEEIYPWMAHYHGFKEHTWAEYLSFRDGTDSESQQAYDERSYKLMMKYMERDEQKREERWRKMHENI